jgi:hypothetical protein
MKKKERESFGKGAGKPFIKGFPVKRFRKCLILLSYSRIVLEAELFKKRVLQDVF